MDPLNLESQQSKKNSRGSPEFHNKNLRQIGPGVHELWSDKQTDRQTNKQTSQIYI